MNKQRLVVIGNGMAGVRVVENILRENPSAYEIIVIGSEPRPGYSRLMLSTVLQGGTSIDDITIHPSSWYRQSGVNLITGETVVKVDASQKAVLTDQHRKVHYDKLIFATGSSPFMLPLKGAKKKGVIAFRTIEDCESILTAAREYKKAVVIGGGLLGLEAARGLLNIGMEVDVVHISSHIMNRQLDEKASIMLQRQLEEQGMNFLLNKASEKILGRSRVEGVRFKDGSVAEADLVVMAVGIKPRISLAEAAGLETNHGIIVNDYLETSCRDIYAVGECAEHNGRVYGLVQPLYEQGEILAKHLCGIATDGYQGSLLYTQLKISGVEVFSIGQFEPNDDETKSIEYHNEEISVYKKVLFKGNKAVGAVLVGTTEPSQLIKEAVIKRKVLASKDKALLLENPDPKNSAAASYPMNQTICTCNQVSKGAIVEAMRQEGLSTVEDIKESTKASSSCGGCKSLVTDLLNYIRSEPSELENAMDLSLCSCTSLTEDELVEQIQIQNLRTAEAVYRQLYWKREDGCSICRLAVDYYLEMIYPPYKGSMQAQEKKRNTVVPQIYGGMMTLEQLRKITKAAEKFPYLQVAVSRDQRIHLIGVKDHDFPALREELDMQLREYNGHQVAPITTAAGDYECDCEKSSSVKIAQVIEKETEGLQVPYRLKLGISACFHNRADAEAKDIGALYSGGKWEIYIGGSSMRRGQLLCVVQEEERVETIVLACLQYYRKSARYLEETSQWVERLGLIHIREALFDEELCHHLMETLEEDNDLNRKRVQRS
ncbi:nitrite reductase large subunit NirB [Halobacillus sp. Marseille-Q1614]|uniref:nitrite reductase large subunit NirB n=1 Tax=Halobacillus sp. Marseille-Q1614 TaxID=2709134 RepID=UPI00156D9072|nr:nitrite reductase large subunit NirB [Halobacillus sp. Marseille-Q1614]